MRQRKTLRALAIGREIDLVTGLSESLFQERLNIMLVFN